MTVVDLDRPLSRGTSKGPRLTDLHARKDHLAAVRAQLHEHFIGIDSVIDELCDAVAVWWLMPQLLTRPVVVNLWGMTGVGKTDLVRRLVVGLGLQGRFVEIELSNTDDSDGMSTFTGRLAAGGLLDGQPGVVLLDEVQRFRTLTRTGEPVGSTRFPEVWELLSDGRLSRRSHADLGWVLAKLRAEGRDRRGRPADPEDPDEIGLWQARELARAAGLDVGLDELAKLSHDEAAALTAATVATGGTHAPIDCTQMLVLVSGNLDDAFTMSGAADDADVDADIHAAYTRQVTVVDVKAALRRRFTPEQVARFGNVHLLYPGLGRGDFERVIAREIARVAAAGRERLGVRVRVTPAVHELVYANGVFPVQGVRPVLSSVGDIVATPLARLLVEAVQLGAGEVVLDHDARAGELVGRLGSREIRIPFEGRVDRIRSAARDDEVAGVAVHEAGHAVAYAVIFGLAPVQLSARLAASDTAGFTFGHRVTSTRSSMLDEIVVALAGGLAEEAVFGMDHASAGRAGDRSRATELALDHVRRYGFDCWHSDFALRADHEMDSSVTDADVEALLRQQAERARELLAAHRGAVLALARRLAADGTLRTAQVAAVLADHGVSAMVAPEGWRWQPPYAALLATAD